jgi:hypothetical protein
LLDGYKVEAQEGVISAVCESLVLRNVDNALPIAVDRLTQMVGADAWQDRDEVDIVLLFGAR